MVLSFSFVCAAPSQFSMLSEAGYYYKTQKSVNHFDASLTTSINFKMALKVKKKDNLTLLHVFLGHTLAYETWF